jgi:hypothetical protein
VAIDIPRLLLVDSANRRPVIQPCDPVESNLLLAVVLAHLSRWLFLSMQRVPARIFPPVIPVKTDLDDGEGVAYA